MALHHDLPIYKIAYGLLRMSTGLIRNLPRDLKTSLGSKIRDECIEILVLIARTNASKDKSTHLAEVIERVDVVRFLMRVLMDERHISTKQHANTIELTESISKQANGWKKSSMRSPAV